MSDGRVYLVGAGPGDPGLITVRGRELLQQADAVVYDALVSPQLLTITRDDAELIYAGKRAGDHSMHQEEINALLVKLGRAGKQVVRLKGGDPYVFGRGGEEALALAAESIAFEIVPGVTAGAAGAAYAGIPVTHRMVAGSVAFITGHESTAGGESTLDYDVLAKWPGTLVFYMGVRNARDICAKLMSGGMPPSTPAAMIRWATTADQKTVTATLADLADATDQAGLKPPAIIVIGQVVKLREQLAWFERRPLFGRRIVVTRARTQASQLTRLLAAQGASITELPAIRIEPPADPAPLAAAVSTIGSFDWTVFTSVNAVEAFFAALERAGLDSRALASTKIAVVGPATAQCVRKFGLRPDIQPQTYTGKDVCETLAAAHDLNGAAMLYPHSDLASGDLPDALAAAGARVTAITAYRTVARAIAPEEVAELLAGAGADWITFTSSSTVASFLAAMPADQLRESSVRLASIGPSTTRTLTDAGLQPTVEAKPHTMPGLTQAIVDFEQCEETKQR